MTTTYQHLNVPRRGPYYFAIGTGLVYAYITAAAYAPIVSLAVVGLSFFLAAMIWLAFRHPPAGMEISNGEWRIFRGHSHWSVPLRDIASVRVIIQHDAPALLALVHKGGRTELLPPELAPEIGPLAGFLARYGIPVQD